MTGSDGSVIRKGAPDSGRKRSGYQRIRDVNIAETGGRTGNTFLYGNELERCSNYGGCSCDFRAVFALDKQNEIKEKQARQKQMCLDYPEVISKLTLLLGAGMTVRKAWRKIVNDYDSRIKQQGKRAVYEEMRYTCRQMDGGVPEAECYEKFGRRCGTQEYMRFGALLSQNLRKGTKRSK